MSVIDLLASSNFLTVNKSLIKLFGLKAAVLLGELCAEYSYWEKEEKLDDGWFYSTVENIEENTGLSIHEQRQALKQFEEINLLKTEKRGMPAKRYIKLDQSQLVKIFTESELNFNPQSIKNSLTSQLNFNSQVSENLHLNNNNILLSNKLDNNIKNNNKKSEILVDTKIRESSPNNSSLFSTKKRKSKKNVFSDCLVLIENNFTDEEVKSKLKQYLENRIKKSLTAEQWNEIIQELKVLAKTKNEALTIISNSYLSNWMKFYPLITKSKQQTYKDNFVTNDVTSNMTLEERLDYINKNIVTDENGNPLIF